MTVPIIGREQATVADVIKDFLERRKLNRVSNVQRDNTIAALCLVVEALAKRDLAQHPEAVDAAVKQAEAALAGTGAEPSDG